MPEIYNEIEVYGDILPNNHHSPCHPFSGFVLNINVATKAHRDRKDLEACIVLDIGEHEDGDLVLYEPGLVVPLRNGDAILFFSNKITHFNLIFKGIRASIVLHSDMSGKEWAADRNSWEDNNYMT